MYFHQIEFWRSRKKKKLAVFCLVCGQEGFAETAQNTYFERILSATWQMMSKGNVARWLTLNLAAKKPETLRNIRNIRLVGVSLGRLATCRGVRLYSYCYASQSRRCTRAQDCCVCVGRLSGQSPVGLLCRCRCRSLCCCGGWCVGVAVVVVVVVGVVHREMFVFWSFDLGFWILGLWIFGSRILEFEAGQILDWMRTARFHEEAKVCCTVICKKYLRFLQYLRKPR